MLDMVYERKDGGLTDEDWKELYERINDEDDDIEKIWMCCDFIEDWIADKENAEKAKEI